MSFEDGTTIGRGIFAPGWRWSDDVIPPGHDAWVDGDSDCEILDFVGYTDYARSKQDVKKTA